MDSACKGSALRRSVAVRRVVRNNLMTFALALLLAFVPCVAHAEEMPDEFASPAWIFSMTVKPLPTSWLRLWGQDRYQTMAAIASEGFERCETCVLVAGDDPAAALAANPLAGAYGCPLVTTTPHALPDAARETIQRLGCRNVIIVGNELSVSPEVESSLEDLGIAHERLSGADATSLSLAVMEALRSGGPGSDTVIVANGERFADALAIGPWAYHSTSAVLLTNEEGTLDDAQVAAIHADPKLSQVLIVGGESSVSEVVCDQVGEIYHTRRLAGEDRYATAGLVALWEVEHGLSWARMVVASGSVFADALTGAAFAGHRGEVLLLVDGRVDDAIVMTRAYGSTPEWSYVVGGPDVVADPSFTVSPIFELDEREVRLMESAERVPWPGPGLCAGWVADVYEGAGYPRPGGDARDMYYYACESSSLLALRPGMVIGVPHHPHTNLGSIYGHVGIYVGSGVVRQSMNERIKEMPLSEWVDHYGADVTPAWGWAL